MGLSFEFQEQMRAVEESIERERDEAREEPAFQPQEGDLPQGWRPLVKAETYKPGDEQI